MLYSKSVDKAIFSISLFNTWLSSLVILAAASYVFCSA